MQASCYAVSATALRTFGLRALIIGSLLVVLSSCNATADSNARNDSVCQSAAKTVAQACELESRSDYLLAKAICNNLVSADARDECLEEASEEEEETGALCREQREARLDLCTSLGETAYDPSDTWQAANFVDPLQIGGAIPANPYLPLIPGSQTYEGEDETITVTVTGETKLINGVTCVTVRDTAAEDGVVTEDTDDWMAQDIFGAVWYCGEISQNFELYEGDNPAEPELVDVEGSWKAFRDGALPGVLMPANPVVGQFYRQEMALGDAEDAAEVLHTSADALLPGDACDDAEIATFVDEQCSADCLVTRDFTPIEPDQNEHKYYAPAIGLIAEVGGDGSCVVLSAE